MLNNQMILPIIIQNNNIPYYQFNINNGIIKGQLVEQNENIYINQNNNNIIWNQINGFNNINFDIGHSIFLGNLIPQVIYHNLNKFPNFINITPLVSLNFNLGDIYLNSFDDIKFSIVNSGDFNGKFCWFII